MENILTLSTLTSQGKSPMSVSRLVNAGKLGNLGFGYYTDKPSILRFDTDFTIRKINRLLDQFPFPPARAVFSSISLNFCINQTITSTTYIVEVEKEYSQMVFEILKDKLNNVVLYKPSKEEKINYWKPDAVYVVELYSKSPTNKDGTFTIEKLIVDLLFDEEMYSLYSGQDIEQAIQLLCTRYTVNYRTLFAYASRKRKRKELYQTVEKYIPEVIKE